MKNLEELEKKYAELGREIEALKSEHKYPIYCLGRFSGVVVKFTSLNQGVVVKQNNPYDVGHKDNWRIPHTDVYYWQQLDVCPDTGFYDGQLVWAWDEGETHKRAIIFYDAKNKRTFLFDVDRGWLGYDNYEPYEGNYPEWALKAFKTLVR